MYLVFIYYEYVYNVLHFILNQSIRVVVGEGTFIQRRHSVNEKTVVKSGWSYMRVVVREGFH